MSQTKQDDLKQGNLTQDNLKPDLNSSEFEQLNLAEIGLDSKDFADVSAIYKQLSIDDVDGISLYGQQSAAQTSEYTDQILQAVQSKDLDQTGQKLNQLLKHAKKINAQQLLAKPKSHAIPVIGSLLAKFKDGKHHFQQQFSDAKQQIELIVEEVSTSQQGLQDRVDMLNMMHSAVQDQYRQLGLHVAAGQLKLKDVNQQTALLSSVDQDQVQAHDQLQVQQQYDISHFTNNLSKRVHDLQMLQQSALQSLPMIRMIQANNLMLIDKFYAIKNITIPAWKNQISLALSLNEQRQSVELAERIDDATNELLRRNAELLHQNSVDTARSNQRAVIDIETIEYVQNQLIETVNDVIKVQQQGQSERKKATEKLHKLQQQLNQLVDKSNQQIS